MTSKQQIMLRLARTNRVFYVNPSMSLLSPMSGWDEIPFRKKLAEVHEGPRRVFNNLYVGTPPFALPLRFFGLPNLFNSMVTSRWLNSAIQRIGMNGPILWTFQPESDGVVKRIKKCLSIYHCVDEHSAVGIWWRPPRLVRNMEKKLIETVHLVITTSRNLKLKKAKFNRNCHFVPNAADFELFSRARRPDTEVPSDLSKLPKPIVGYVGMFYPDLIDVGCLEYVVKNSRCSFVFIGRKINDNFDLSPLEKYRNVHFLGFKNPTQLSCYLKGIDVCIMPSVKNEVTDAVFPLKLFEYLAAGKPIVATRTEELSKYEDIIHLVDTPDQFLKAIDICLNSDSPDKITARVSLAKENTWDVRVEMLCKLIEGHLKNKHQ